MTLEEHTLAMITSAGLPLNMWGEAVLTAAYLMNHSVTRALPSNVTPYEVFNGRKPDLSHIRVWGCRCFAPVLSELQTKLGIKSRECIFVGYPSGTKAYCVRDCQTGTFFVARDVIFDENIAYRGLHNPKSSMSLATPGPSALVQPVASTSTPPASLPVNVPSHQPIPPRVPSSCSRIPTPLGLEHKELVLRARVHLEKCRAVRASRLAVARVSEPALAIDGSEPPLSDAAPGEVVETEPVETLAGPSTLETAIECEHANIVCEELAMITIHCETRQNPSSTDYNLCLPPATFEEALLCPDADKWREAMDKELETMLKMGVYSVVECLKDRKQIGCQWVLEFKVAEGADPIYKARLVAKCFSQIPHINFGSTFAPVARTSSVRIVLALANRMDWEINCFDTTCTFLWGDLEEELYMCLPKGFQGEGGPGKCWHLWKSIYRLKQASNIWYKKLKSILIQLGFSISAIDHTLFHYSKEWRNTTVHCLLAMHIDDSVGGSNSRAFLE
jgi:Reverse transcriptase (RNA-dependent DNA polymerase)